MQVYFDNNYPKNLADALSLVHELNTSKVVKILRTQKIEVIDKEQSVVFLFDHSKKGLSILTNKHFEQGYKIFAFKLNSTEAIDLFQLTLMTLKLWPKILFAIEVESNPFVYTFNYNGKCITKVR